MSEVLERLPTQERAPEQSGTLAELAERANREHHAAEAAATEAVSRAIACGKLLLDARQRISGGSWGKWLLSNFDGAAATAATYIRLATYEEFIPGGLSQEEAVRRIKYLPPANDPGGGVAETVHQAAVARAAEPGVNQRQVAREFGVNETTLRGWLDPEFARARQRRTEHRRAAVRRALREQKRHDQRERAARRAGGSLGKSYSLIRRVTQQLDLATQQVADAEARQALSRALSRAHQAEDEIVRALGVE